MGERACLRSRGRRRSLQESELARAGGVPGEILLEEFLKPLELGQLEAARRLRISLNRLNEIVLGQARHRGYGAPTRPPAEDLATVLDAAPGRLGPASSHHSGRQGLVVPHESRFARLPAHLPATVFARFRESGFLFALGDAGIHAASVRQPSKAQGFGYSTSPRRHRRLETLWRRKGANQPKRAGKNNLDRWRRGSRSTRIVEFSNDFENSIGSIGEKRQKALVQVQNRYQQIRRQRTAPANRPTH